MKLIDNTIKPCHKKSSCTFRKGPVIYSKSNIFKRFVLSIVMILLFIILCYIHRIYLMILVLLITVFVSKEIIGISKKPNKNYAIRPEILFGISSIPYYYFTASAFFEIHSTFFPKLLRSHHGALCFYTYLGALMMFIVKLRKENLKSQFGLFALAQLVGYVSGVINKLAILNINQGKFWFIYPVALVVSNDIFAYLVGKLCGKTPLFALSPKKAIEGFVGGFFATILASFVLCYLRIQYNLLADEYQAALMEKVVFMLNRFTISFHKLYLHQMPFIFVTSFIAPFSGFLASALKRAYKKKDFGETIPGHGGITDRMDCQLFTVVFTYVYLHTVLNTNEKSIVDIYNYAVGNYSKSEIVHLIKLLEEAIA